MMIGVAHRGLPNDDHRQDGAKKTGKFGGRAIDVPVNLSVTGIKGHVGLIHRYWFRLS